MAPSNLTDQPQQLPAIANQNLALYILRVLPAVQAKPSPAFSAPIKRAQLALAAPYLKIACSTA